jgi:hypothetical protein
MLLRRLQNASSGVLPPGDRRDRVDPLRPSQPPDWAIASRGLIKLRTTPIQMRQRGVQPAIAGENP